MDSSASPSATGAEAITLELDALQREAEVSIAQAERVAALEPIRIKCLGRKSRLSEIMKLLGTLGPEQRALVGKRANAFKTAIETSLQARQQQLLAAPRAHATIDLTLPGLAIPQGRLHPITQTIQTILEAFVPMGFEIIEGPELEREHYNFDALNIPRDHPSRESFDTFFVDLPVEPHGQQGRVTDKSEGRHPESVRQAQDSALPRTEGRARHEVSEG